MIFSFSTCRLVLLVSAACNAMTSAELTVNLGGAGHYAILAMTGISTVPSSNIYGDIAVSPIDEAAMTGFALTLDLSEQFSKSTQVFASSGGDASSTHSGHAYAASYGAPISDVLTVAVVDMETAYTDAANRLNADATRINVEAGILGGLFGGPDDPLTPGVYTFDTNVFLNGDVHFSGDGVYIIQMTGNLVQAAGYEVILGAGARAENIFWQVEGFVEVGAGATMQGIILAKTKVDFITGSSLKGRVLTQTACNLQMATITEPSPEPTDTTITEPDTEPIEGSDDLVSFFYLELETDGNPEDDDIFDAVDLFVDSYNQLLVTEYDDSFDRRMSNATNASVESLSPGSRRLDHPQQESRQLGRRHYLLFLRISGSCRGCGSNSFFTNQSNRRDRKLLDESGSDNLLPGVPTEAALLAAYSSELSSSLVDYGSIVGAVSLYEVSEP
jgi:hypothetical protein